MVKNPYLGCFMTSADMVSEELATWHWVSPKISEGCSEMALSAAGSCGGAGPPSEPPYAPKWAPTGPKTAPLGTPRAPPSAGQVVAYWASKWMPVGPKGGPRAAPGERGLSAGAGGDIGGKEALPHHPIKP